VTNAPEKPVEPRGAGYVCIWEYVVEASHVEAFERTYGPEGEWVQLFRRADGYLRTELHRDRSRPTRFVSIDYWRTRDAWNTFRASFASEFEELDARCERLTLSERELGTFEPVD